ncbi:MAG: hypothetical protein HY319_29475 [Armatimonadetes bacterium]|nr:hypothetical protein [Armatimonadota bacterium]
MILSVVSVILVGVIPSTIIGLKGAGQRAFAAVLAQETLERLKRDGFANIQDSTEPFPVVVANGTRFTVQVITSEAVAFDGTAMPMDEALAVEVLVTWTSKSGAQRHQARQIVFRRV